MNLGEVFGSCDGNQASPPSVTDFAQAQEAPTVPVLGCANPPERDVSQQDFVIPCSEEEKQEL